MSTMNRLSFLFPLSVLHVLSCSGKDGSGDSAPTAELTVLVNAPSPASTYYSNEQVPFEVVARLDGEPADVTHATWSLDDGAQEKEGATGNFDPMSAGEHAVHVEVLAGGQSASRDVTFTVSPPEGDADTDADTDTDTDADATQFIGTIEANIDYHGDFGDFGSPCPGTLSFTLDAAHTIVGSGTCRTTDGGYDFPFTMDGAASGGVVSGNLVMTYDGTDALTPYTGHGGSQTTITANFDETFNSGSDTIRIYGSFSADPQ